MACFGFSTSNEFFWFYYSMDSLFLMDSLLCFFTQYHGEESNKPVHDIKLVAIRYIKSGFIVDVLATFPFHLVMLSQFEDPDLQEKMNLFFLLKMLRFRKMISLFETKNFQDFIKGLFKNRLQRIIQNK